MQLSLVPPAGFEPAISTLKGWRPGPLDDGGLTTCGIIPAVVLLGKSAFSFVPQRIEGAELYFCSRQPCTARTTEGENVAAFVVRHVRCGIAW